MLKYLMLLLLAFTSRLFSLVPMPESNLGNDLGLLLLISLLAYVLISRRGRIQTLFNAYTWMIFLYFCLAAFQAVQASVNYDQPLFKGLMGIRHQLYYLSFFVFIMMFRDMKDIKAFLNLLAVTAVVLFVLSLIHYTGLRVFQFHANSVRGGVERGFIPGMDIISISLFWLASSWGTSSGGRYPKIGAVLLYAAHIFRQTRSRLLVATLVIGLILLVRKQYKALVMLTIFGVAAVSVANVFLPEGYFYNLFVSAFTDVVENEGSWDGRAVQLEVVMEVFKEHPIFGGGTLALSKDSKGVDNIFLVARTRDLGYGHWIKSYGVVGLIWLLTYLYIIWRYARQALKKSTGEEDQIPLFLTSYVMFIFITSITLNYFMIPSKIILLCMIAAIAVRLHQLSGKTADG